MTTKTLPLFTLRDDMVEANVWEAAAGYAVTLRDFDADEVVATRVFPYTMDAALDRAVAFARTLVEA